MFVQEKPTGGKPVSLLAIASVRADIVALRDSTIADLDRYLTLQDVVDALDRAQALCLSLGSSPTGHAGDAIAEAAAELKAALGAAAGFIGPTLSQRIAAIAPMLDEALARVAPRTRSARQENASAGVRRSSTGGGLLSAPAPATPLPAVAPVRFGASAPTAAAAGSRFVAQFVAYPEGAADAAGALLRDGQPDARVVREAFGDDLAIGTRLQVALSGAGMTIEGQPRDVQSFVWTGRTRLLAFEVELAADAASTVLRYDVSVDGIVLAKIRLPLEVSALTKPSAQHSPEAGFAKKAFASYSSKDRLRVIDRVAAIRIAAKVDVFLDCHDLNPGEAWEPSLARAIDSCDTFLLFWSDAAAKSRWVQWEWMRALAKPGLADMQFHPLENGVKPPRELAAIHLGDPYIDLRAAERVRRATTPANEKAP